MRERLTRAERAWLSQYEPSERAAWLMRLRTEPDMTQDTALVAAIQREIDEAVAEARKEKA